jgi:hypothetical protein
VIALRSTTEVIKGSCTYEMNDPNELNTMERHLFSSLMWHGGNGGGNRRSLLDKELRRKHFLLYFLKGQLGARAGRCPFACWLLAASGRCSSTGWRLVS